jgi:hypothetical protein
MSDPNPNLGSFIRFANASVKARGTVLRKIREESSMEYSPVTDFWKRMRDATKTDRRTTRNGEAVYAAADDATDSKRDSYSRVASRWQHFLPRWADSEYETPHKSLVNVDGLVVSVSPRFIELWPSGASERTFVYFNSARLERDTIDAALRLMQVAFPGDDATAVILDAQRGIAHTNLSQPAAMIDGRLSYLSAEFMERWAA